MKMICGILAICAIVLCAGCSGAEKKNDNTESSFADSVTVSAGADVSSAESATDISSASEPATTVSSAAAESSATEAGSKSNSDTSNVEWYDEVLPNWEDFFPDGQFELKNNSTKQYTFEISNATKEQYDFYIDKCAELDFKHGPKKWRSSERKEFVSNPDAEDAGPTVYESDSVSEYKAYRGDKKYLVDISILINKNIITVICERDK